MRPLPNRVLGSPDIFGYRGREPEESLNFVTCHDGFTLNDLVSYNTKHNEANGEGNRDGADNNLSWNCGAEGPSEDREVERLRERLTSIGTPMLLMGEMRRTQRGNTNAYCQDNEISWLDWNLLDRHRNLHRFVRMLISHRLQAMEMRGKESFGLSLNEVLRRAELDWHGVQLAWRAGLVRRFAQYRLHCSSSRPGVPVLAAPDVQRLLATARLRIADGS